MTLLQIENLDKSYRITDRRVPILQNLNLALSAGERLALVGPSGCGKSSLLQIVAGLDRADGGRVRLGEVELGALDARALALLRRRELGIVFQFFNLFSSLTLLDNVLLPGRLERAPARPLRARAEALLERVGLAAKRGARTGELSGGEMQRAALCRALLLKPKLLLADEPTGNLDSENRRRVYQLLRDLSREEGCAVLLATHDAEAAAWTDRGLAMRDGRVAPA
ncbi:MAG: ABC transporter ATP-binding protein [Deltaproteobacteria bacterium]|nr:ABC transporter ATP-binding protein [Deltaproteobacteria bacterium]